jgi:hypothetical protein
VMSANAPATTDGAERTLALVLGINYGRLEHLAVSEIRRVVTSAAPRR